MTIEEFDKMGFTAGMEGVYNNALYDIISVSFYERLICLNSDGSELWVRCENVTLIY